MNVSCRLFFFLISFQQIPIFPLKALTKWLRKRVRRIVFAAYLLPSEPGAREEVRNSLEEKEDDPSPKYCRLSIIDAMF